jgi:predicted MFS family arabinose efflux permease
MGAAARVRALLVAASALMAATGIGFALGANYWLLLAIAFIGTINPSAGDVSVFVPLEQTALSASVADRDRTDMFARYGVVKSVFAALGTLLAIAPERLAEHGAMTQLGAYQAAYFVYAALGLAAGALYARMRAPAPAASARKHAPLGPSRGVVLKLTALFSVDSFGGGIVVQSILALWLFERFGLSVSDAAQLFFWMNLLAAISFPLAVRIAARIGLINTMVFTHLPANLCLMALPLADSFAVAVALLLVRALLSQMDVPTRQSYVMAVVTPEERPAAASVTNLPRSLAASLGPSLGGFLLALGGFGWPFVLAGALKAGYDLALLRMFRGIRPPEER